VACADHEGIAIAQGIKTSPESRFNATRQQSMLI
jgi:hypothetical protein